MSSSSSTIAELRKRSRYSQNSPSELDATDFGNIRSAFQLLVSCGTHGIRLSLADGGGLSIDAPQSALTPERLNQIRAYKAELVALLQAEDVDTASADEVIDCPDPCSCGSLELWQSLARNWHCLSCEPPRRAQQLKERAAKLKRQRRRRPAE